MARSTRHPVFARFYAKVGGPALARAGMDAHRRGLLAGLTGEVLELGVGPGLNFPFYPPEVTRVVAVEPEPRLRALAEQAARTAPVPVEVVATRAEHLAVADASFDAAVACLVLCSVADQPAALAELHRVLRPGGVLRFFEHVQAQTSRMRRVQRALDATVWPLLNGGCHTGRDTATAITTAGFIITDLHHLAFPDTKYALPATAHISGTAVRRADTA